MCGVESSPSGWNSDISDIPQADENLFIPGTMFLALVRRARHHARVGLALGQPPSARLTSVYAVSQRDFSFEFRLRDYFFAYTCFPQPPSWVNIRTPMRKWLYAQGKRLGCEPRGARKDATIDPARRPGCEPRRVRKHAEIVSTLHSGMCKGASRVARQTCHGRK